MVDTTTHDVMVAQTEKAGQLLDYFHGHREMLEADRLAHAAAVAAEIGNLKGVVNDQMHFSATIDPDEPNPTNIDGGTFASISRAVHAAPGGALVVLALLAGKTYPVNGEIAALNRSVVLKKTGSGANPELQSGAYSYTSGNGSEYNAVYQWVFERGGSLALRDVDVTLPGKSDPALNWSSNRAVVDYGRRVGSVLSISGGTVSGADDRVGLVSAHAGNRVDLCLSSVTLDGPFAAIVNADNGVSQVGTYSVTLQNGAQIADGGTLGVNMLKN